VRINGSAGLAGSAHDPPKARGEMQKPVVERSRLSTVPTIQWERRDSSERSVTVIRPRDSWTSPSS
jgi:hypothetical protein